MKINYEDFVRHLYHFFRIYSSELIRAVSHVKVLVAWLCLTLCRPMDYSPPGSSVHGILQARILEWIAIPFSKCSSGPRNQIQVSCIAGRFFSI